MSNANRLDDDDLQPEYDFGSMKGGVRGKYVTRLQKGSNLVLLEPEIAEASLRGGGQRGSSGRSQHREGRPREGRPARQGTPVLKVSALARPPGPWPVAPFPVAFGALMIRLRPRARRRTPRAAYPFSIDRCLESLTPAGAAQDRRPRVLESRRPRSPVH
jgi:hypothetical protein